MLLMFGICRDFNLISNDKFDANVTTDIYTQLFAVDGEMESCLSFDKFVTALLEISRRFYGESSDVVELQRIIKHCS